MLTYNYLPFMVLALWASFEGWTDPVEAASDLGASRTQTFLGVVLPLTSPGLLAGFLMVLVLVAGDYLTPQLVGGSSGVTVTSAIHDLFGAAFDWPMASALAWVLLAVLALRWPSPYPCSAGARSAVACKGACREGRGRAPARRLCLAGLWLPCTRPSC